MRSTKRFAATCTAVLVVLAATVAAGCGGGSSRNPSDAGTGSAAAGRTGGTLVWGKPADVQDLDPHTALTGVSWELHTLVYDRLVDVDDHLKVKPELAQSWKQTSPTTYLFKLRPGVRFSNGRELTAADVVGSLKRISANWWGPSLGIRAVSATGAAEVKVTLVKPRTAFLAALAHNAAAILPMKELRSGSFDPKKEMLGTGPFKVVAHSQGESWTFARNPYYWDKGKPRADRLVVKIMPDTEARIAALRDGNIDVTTFGSSDTVRLLQGQANIQTVVQQTTDFFRLFLNATSSIFTDARLREAVSLAIDRDKLAKVALGGVGQPSAAVAPAFKGVCDPSAMPYAKPDLARARALVDAAGARGKTVSIIVTPDTEPLSSPIAQVLQGGLQAAGLKVRIDTIDLGEDISRVYSGKADFDLEVGSFAGYGDPAMALGWWNPYVAGFNKAWLLPDKELIRSIDVATTTPAGNRRSEALRRACGRVAQDANMIPLVTKNAIVAYRSDKIDAPVLSVEGSVIPLRNIADFRVKSR